MALSLETGSVQDIAAKRALDAVAAVLIDTGGRSIRLRYGTASFAFVAATVVTVTITHGLGGVVPRAIVAMTSAGSAGGISYNSTNEGVTTFDLRAVSPGAITATVTAWWIAIG